MQLITLQNKVFLLFRRRRMKTFIALFAPSNETRVLDIGGAPNTWLNESCSEIEFPVTLLNLRYPDSRLADDRFTPVSGDATDLPFADGSFEIAFSNSVIEHMTTWERQQTFAREARRVADKLWIQTPARSFPLEPHVLAPLFQYLPRRWQTCLARHFTLWGLMTKPSPERVDEMLCDIRLLTYKEMRQLFPDCRILKERLCGLTKSYVAVRGCQ
jgi:hypothetical protein